GRTRARRSDRPRRRGCSTLRRTQAISLGQREGSSSWRWAWFENSGQSDGGALAEHRSSARGRDGPHDAAFRPLDPQGAGPEGGARLVHGQEGALEVARAGKIGPLGVVGARPEDLQEAQ